jgi:amino acid adenylation domain-containing protein
MNLIEASYRLTSEQSEILLDSGNLPSRGERLTSELPPDLQPDLFEHAWRMATERHPVLRTAFEEKGLREPIQHVRVGAECGMDTEEGGEEFIFRHDLAWNRHFNAAEAPLMHMSLGKNQEGDWLFSWTSHDLILDSRARRIVIKDVAECYESLLNSQPIKSVASPAFRTYVNCCSPANSSIGAPYARPLHDPSSKISKLMIPQTVQDIQNDRWGSTAISITTDAETRLRNFAHRIKVPLNVVVQCAWAGLLSKYCGDCEVSYGALETSAAGPPGALEIVGPLTSSVSRLLNVHPGRSIADVARELHSQIEESTRLRDGRPETNFKPVAPKPPLLAAMVRLLESDAPWQPFVDDSFWRHQRWRVTTGCPLTLTGSVATVLTLQLVYERARWASSSISNMAVQLGCVLDAISQVQRVGQLLVDTEKSKRHRVLVGAASSVETHNTACVYELFAQQVLRVPTQVAVVHEGRRISYLELSERVDQLAAELGRRGVGPETIVGLYLPRSVSMVVSVLAVLKSGGAYLPLDTEAPAERVRTILLDAKPQCALVEEEARDIDWAACELIRVNTKGSVAVDLPAPSLACADGAAYVLYTSGSTGRPKGVVVENRQLLNYVRSVIQEAGLEECTQFAMLQPLTVDSSVTVLYASLSTGGSLHIISEEAAMDPHALSAYFEGEKIDCLKIAPSHLAALHSGVAPSRLVPQRRLIVGGEASSHSWLASVARSAQGCIIFNHYGPTETTVGVLMHRFVEAKSMPGATVPIGLPLANCRAYILDQQGELVPSGVTGELYIGGNSVARGYIHRPSLTALHFLPDPFASRPGQRMYRTGDLVRYCPRNGLEFCGRADDQVKIRGYRVEPSEIKSVLEQHPDVSGAIVLPFRCVSGGQQLAAFVVSSCGKPLKSSTDSL